MHKDIEKLIVELFDKDIDKKITKEDVDRIFAQNNVTMFAYRRNGNIVSMVMAYIIELFSRKFAVIEEVVTLREYRNQGISSGLIKDAIEWAKEKGLDCIELNVRDDRPDIQHFYENLGFKDRHNKAMRLWIKK